MHNEPSDIAVLFGTVLTLCAGVPVARFAELYFANGVALFDALIQTGHELVFWGGIILLCTGSLIVLWLGSIFASDVVIERVRGWQNRGRD